MADLKLPFYRHFPRDALADSRLAVMSLEQQGALLRLADHCWVDGAIPNDPANLARLLRISKERFEEHVWPGIVEFFVEDGDGLLQHEDLALEREQLLTRKQRQSAGGRKGARRRWESGPVDGDAHGDLDACPSSDPTSQPNEDPTGHPIESGTHPIGRPTRWDRDPPRGPIASSEGRRQRADGRGSPLGGEATPEIRGAESLQRTPSCPSCGGGMPAGRELCETCAWERKRQEVAP